MPNITQYGTGQELAAASGLGTPASPLVPSVGLAAGENHIGGAGTPGAVVSVTLSLFAEACEAGDLIAETQAVAAALRANGGTAILQDVVVIDEDDNGAAFDIYILGATGTFGTEGVAAAPSDAVCRNIQAIIPIATADYKDLGGAKIANVACGKLVKAESDSTSLFVAVVNGAGTPTYTASGVRLVFKFAHQS